MPAVTNIKSSPIIVALAFSIVYVVWGSTYFFIRIAVAGMPPFILGFVRFTASGLIMLIWCIYKKEQLFTWKNIKYAAISGVLLLFVATGAVMWAEQFLPSALVAILVSASPLWFVLLDKAKWKENLSNTSSVLGLLLGFTGVIILFYEKISGSFTGIVHTAEIVSLGILIIGTAAWAGGSLYAKARLSKVSSSVTATWQMLAAGFAFLPVAVLTNEFSGFKWQDVPDSAWYSIIYLVVFGSIAAFSAYVWLLNVRAATQVSTYAYVNPVVAVLLGVFFANETITFLQVAGLMIILASVLLINLAKYRSNK